MRPQWSTLFSVGLGVRGYALLPTSQEFVEDVELRWSESAINGPVGSPNAFPWPSIDCVVDSGPELRRLLNRKATAVVTEKLDGSNLCVHSNGVVASRRIVLANNSGLEDFKNLRYCIHHIWCWGGVILFSIPAGSMGCHCKRSSNL